MNILYAFNPRTATLPIAKYVLSKYDIELAAVRAQKKAADELVGALLDVMTKTGTGTLQDFELMLAAGTQQGYDGGKEEALLSERAQFWAALSPEIKPNLPPFLIYG